MSGNVPTRLEPVCNTINQRAAALLRSLADDADAGDILAVTVVAEMPGGRYRLIGSQTLNRREMMGALMEALLWRSADGS
jgi:hypothetical protein